MDDLLRTHELSKTYRRRKVVDRVDLTVNEGEIVGLLGANGAGKTTSFRMVVGMVQPDEGKVLLRGRDVTKAPMYRRARYGMGYLSQEKSVFRRMTARDNITAVLEARGVRRSQRLQEATRLLRQLQLEHVADSPAELLSGGECRRLEISRALATRPSLLLLDEPFAGVDPITVEEIQKILADLSRNQGIAILITDHAVAETLRISDRAYILDKGQVIATGDPQTIIRNKRVREVYLGQSFGEGLTEAEGRELELD